MSGYREILEQVRDGALSVDDALLTIKKKPFADIGYAKVDLHRGVRQGAPEVIFGAGKKAAQIAGIIDSMKTNGQERILITRLSEKKAGKVKKLYEMTYYEEARIGIVGGIPKPDGIGKIVVATGGTSDIPVAEEAAFTA